MTEATAILVPVLNRPWRVRPLLANIEAATPEPHRVLFLCSAGDEAELRAVRDVYESEGDARYGQDYGPYLDFIVALPDRGRWAQKINLGYEVTEEPFVFTGADDLRFYGGWLSSALEQMINPAVGVVGTMDECNPRTANGSHSTHSLVRRSYVETQSGVIDQPGVVLNEAYPHDYADDELVQTAMHRGAYAHAYGSVVEHLHPLCGKGEVDATYELGLSIGPAEGRRLFEQRAHLWGGSTGAPRRLRRAPDARRR